MNEVIVVYNNKVIRVPVKAWNEVLGMAGQMKDDYADRAKELGVGWHLIKQTEKAYMGLSGITAGESK